MRRTNICIICGDGVTGRTYKNAKYCINCLDHHPRYSSEYHKEYSKKYNPAYYQIMKFVGCSLLASGLVEEVIKNENDVRRLESNR